MNVFLDMSQGNDTEKIDWRNAGIISTVEELLECSLQKYLETFQRNNPEHFSGEIIVDLLKKSSSKF